ncbi:MAG: globin [Phenylobacterium sp.]
MAERVGDPAPQVYARLFAAYPETEALFVRDTSGAVRGEMLAVAIQCLLDLREGRHFGGNLIATERVNHDGFGVPAEAFAQFFPILMQTFRELLGEAWTPAMESAWSGLLAELDAINAGVA